MPTGVVIMLCDFGRHARSVMRPSWRTSPHGESRASSAAAGEPGIEEEAQIGGIRGKPGAIGIRIVIAG